MDKTGTVPAVMRYPPPGKAGLIQSVVDAMIAVYLPVCLLYMLQRAAPTIHARLQNSPTSPSSTHTSQVHLSLREQGRIDPAETLHPIS